MGTSPVAGWLLGLLVLLGEEGGVSGVCKTGLKQSPIDIISADSRYQEFRPFTLRGHDSLSLRAGSLYVTNNNGSTIKLKAAASHSSALLGGGPLNVDYEFVEMHFHWGDVEDVQKGDESTGSEHTVDGVNYPLELHLVHQNIHDDTVEEALEHENGLTVLGFKFKVVDEEEHPRNFGLDLLTQIVEQHLTKPNSKFKAADLDKMDTGDDVNVMNFLPVLMDEYFHYQGSLTTGSCDEAVNWIVFKNPLAVTTANLMNLQQMRGLDGSRVTNNFRPTQPVHDRPIYYHGLDLIKNKVIQRGTNIGLRELKSASHSQYLLDLSNCQGAPKPAPMWDTEGERGDSRLWAAKPCAFGCLGPSCEESSGADMVQLKAALLVSLVTLALMSYSPYSLWH